MSRYRDNHLNRVLASEGEILFFARPKKSIQKKDRPDAAFYLRSVVFDGGLPEETSCPSGKARLLCRAPVGLFPTKTPVLGAA